MLSWTFPVELSSGELEQLERLLSEIPPHDYPSQKRQSQSYKV